MCRFHTTTFIYLCFQITIASSMADEVDYLTQIKPLLTEKCYSCHGVLKQESELRLETKSLMVQGGDSGGVIVPGDPEASLLLVRIEAKDPHEKMPPAEEGSALLPDQIALVRSWILQGATAPDEATPTSPSEHWAFQQIQRPSIPSTHTDLPSENPIDALLEAKRAELGLQTQTPAERPILIRRLYLDLIGLPPTREQLDDD